MITTCLVSNDLCNKEKTIFRSKRKAGQLLLGISMIFCKLYTKTRTEVIIHYQSITVSQFLSYYENFFSYIMILQYQYRDTGVS